MKDDDIGYRAETLNIRGIFTPNSTTSASIILPTTVTKSKVFQGSLKKFFTRRKKKKRTGRGTNEEERDVLEIEIEREGNIRLEKHRHQRTHGTKKGAENKKEREIGRLRRKELGRREGYENRGA